MGSRFRWSRRKTIWQRQRDSRGAGVVYDRYGSNLAVQFANGGSPGLATTVSQPVNTDFTSSFRYNGGALPGLPTAAGGSFPLTPPTIVGGFTSFTGIASDLKAPYSYLLNLSYSRPLPKHMSIEVGYIGRLSHAGCCSRISRSRSPISRIQNPAPPGPRALERSARCLTQVSLLRRSRRIPTWFRWFPSLRICSLAQGIIRSMAALARTTSMTPGAPMLAANLTA